MHFSEQNYHIGKELEKSPELEPVYSLPFSLHWCPRPNGFPFYLKERKDLSETSCSKTLILWSIKITAVIFLIGQIKVYFFRWDQRKKLKNLKKKILFKSWRFLQPFKLDICTLVFLLKTFRTLTYLPKSRLDEEMESYDAQKIFSKLTESH